MCAAPGMTVDPSEEASEPAPFLFPASLCAAHRNMVYVWVESQTADLERQDVNSVPSDSGTDHSSWSGSS